MRKMFAIVIMSLAISGCSWFTKIVCPSDDIKLNIDIPQAMVVVPLEPKLKLIERSGVRYVEMSVEEYEKVPELLILLQNRIDVLELYLEQYKKFNE